MRIFTSVVISAKHPRVSITGNVGEHHPLGHTLCQLRHDTVSVKELILVFLEIPNVLAMPVPESVIYKICSESLIFGGKSNTKASLEFHLQRWKHALANIC